MSSATTATHAPAKSTGRPDPKAAVAPKPEKIKVKKPKRPEHPLVGSGDPTVFPFKALPSDYSFTHHAPLKKKAFEGHEAGFLRYKSAELRHKADLCDKRAAVIGDGGTPELQKNKKKLAKLFENLENTKKLLQASGITPEQIDAMLKAAVATATPKTETVDTVAAA